MRKKLLLVFIVSALVFGMCSNIAYSQQSNMRVYIDDKEIFLLAEPVMVNSTLLAPMRGIMDHIGVNVFWDDNSKTIMISKDEATLLFQLDNKVAIINGSAVLLDAEPRIINGQTMVPLRIVIETLNMYINLVNNKLHISTSTDFSDSVNHGKMVAAYKAEDYEGALNYARKISAGKHRDLYYYYVFILSAYEIDRYDLIGLTVESIPDDYDFLRRFAEGVESKDFSGVVGVSVKSELDYYIKTLVYERSGDLANQEVFLTAALSVNSHINRGMLLRKRAKVYESLGVIEKAILDYNESLVYSLRGKESTVLKLNNLMSMLKTEKSNIPLSLKTVLGDKSEYSGQMSNGLPQGVGVQIFTDGKIYIGDFEGGKRSGSGLLMRPEGHLYTGGWYNNNPHGIGTLLWSDGMCYSGSWVNGVVTGKGVMTYIDGTIYDGLWENGFKQGYGTETKTDGTKYIGEFKSNKRTGKGTLEVPQTGIYIGDFVNGRRYGEGKLIASDHTYSGNWVNDVREGQGEVIFKNKDKYTGVFKGNVFQGAGVYTWSNGDVYKGNYTAGEKSGIGELKYKDGGYYVGEFKYDLFEGKGVLYSVNNYKYKGYFVKGEKSGEGELVWESGETYIGSFENDLYCGEGVLTLVDGTRYEGDFVGGVYSGKGVLSTPGQKSLRGEFSGGEYRGVVEIVKGKSEANFADVQKNYRGMTEAEWKVYSNNLLGSRVVWEGAINDVKEDGEVIVTMGREDELVYSVNFYIVRSDVLKYTKDQKIKFEGHIKSIDTLLGFKIELINVVVDVNIEESGVGGNES